MRPVALLMSLSLVFGSACFPDNPRYRTYAKFGEGGALIAGVILLAISNTGADCDTSMTISGLNDNSCKSKASNIGGIGLALILAGLGGFIATVSTTPDDKTPTVTIKAPPPTPPATTPDPTPAPTPPTPLATPAATN